MRTRSVLWNLQHEGSGRERDKARAVVLYRALDQTPRAVNPTIHDSRAH